MRFERIAYVLVQFFPFGQQVVQAVLAQHGTQHGLRQLARCIEVVDHLDDGLFRLDDAEIDDGAHFHRHVVARDHILGRHFQHYGAQVHPHHLLDQRDDEDQSRAFYFRIAPQRKDDAALVLPENADRRGEQQQDDEEQERARPVCHYHSASHVHRPAGRVTGKVARSSCRNGKAASTKRYRTP